MAGELVTYIEIAFAATNGIKDSFVLADALATDYDVNQIRHGTQDIGSSEEELELDGVAVANGWLWMVNRDKDDDIQVIGATGEDPLVLLQPGDVAGFRVNASPTIQVKTTSGSAILEFYLMGGNS